MTTKTWVNGANGNWNTASDWDTGTVPGPGDDAIIQGGTVSLTTPVTVDSISISQAGQTIALGVLSIADPGGTDTVTDNLNNNGGLFVDSASSGSTLTIGGTLTNTGGLFHGSFTIGNSGLTADSTVTAANLSNTGVITLTGGSSARAILDITGAAPATVTGSISLFNSALFEFGSGGITTIANGATLALYSGQARVAIEGNTATNSGLAQLSSNAGTLLLKGGTAVMTDAGTNFLNTGSVVLQTGVLALGGALTNSGQITVNAAALSAASFSNSGTFEVLSGNAGHASATFGELAPSTLSGNIRLFGDASMQFTGGIINSIASGTTLELGTFLGSQPSLTGLSGLTNNAGTLNLDFTNPGGGFYGGMNLSFSNTIANTGTINYGSSFVSNGPDRVTMAGFNNTGVLFMNGGSFSNPVTLNVLDSAPSTLTGDNYVGNNAVLQYNSGAITAIGAGAVLDLSGGRIGLNGQSGSSALTHLASNGGGLHLAFNSGIATDAGVDFSNTGHVQIDTGLGGGGLAIGGALNNSATFLINDGGVATAASLNNAGALALSTMFTANAAMNISGTASNTGTLSVDGTDRRNGSTLSVGGVLSNGGTLAIGNSVFGNNLATTVSASGFVNSGATTISGASAGQTSTLTVNGSTSNSGTLSIGPFATLAVSGGNAFSQTAGSTTVGETLSAGQVNIAGGSLVFNVPLTASAGTGPITLSGGSLVTFGAADSSVQVGFGGPGTIQVDDGFHFAGTIFHFTGADEAVDIRNLSDANNDAHTSFNFLTNQLTVFGDNGSVTLQLDPETYTGVSWSAQQDAVGGTLVTAISAPGSEYTFFAPGQPMNAVATTDPNNVPPPAPGNFNLEVVVNAAGTGSFATAPGYQGLAVRSTDGHTLTMLHGDYGAVDNGAGNTIFLGDGSESIGGAIGDTIQGGSGPSQFLDGHLGHQSITGGTAGNETIWGALTDTVRGGSGGNGTIDGVAGETIFGSTGANVFINATSGSESVLGGSAGNDSIWTAAGDTIHGGSNNETVGGVAGVTMVGGTGGNQFFDASQGHQSVLGGSGGNETIWGAATDTITGGNGGNETIGGVSGETILGGSGANIFVNATGGNQSITGGTAGNLTVWAGAGDTIRGGSDNETIGGVPNDTVIGGTGGNQFIDGSQGHQSILGGSGGNETIWGAATDTITGGSAGNETIGGVAFETILGGVANTFINATAGSESIVAGTGNTTVWGGAQDTVQGASGGGTALIGFAGGNETFWDDGTTTGRHDSISTFSQAGGDRVSLNPVTDTTTNVVASGTTSGGNTTVTFHDGSTLTFIGISSLNTGFFTTH